MGKIYKVGGCVRDMLLGITPSDIDYVAVGYTKEDFLHLKMVGKDFPVFLDEYGNEIALARTERSIGNGYTDFVVDTSNVTLEEDLMRRDLTINAIAYDTDYIDPFNGIADINNKVLRNVSEAFSEDPLRILRIARLRAKLGIDWTIAPETKVMCYSIREGIKALSKERIWNETEKALKLPNSRIYFETLFELGVLEYVSPSIYSLTTLKEGSKYHRESSVFVHTMDMLETVTNDNITLKLAILYHDIAKPFCYRTYGNSSSHDSEEVFTQFIDSFIPTKLVKRIIPIIKNHQRIFKICEMRPIKVLNLLKDFYRNEELLHHLMDLVYIDNKYRKTEEIKWYFKKEDIVNLFKAVFSFTVKEYLKEHTLSPQQIEEYIQKNRLSIIKKEIMCLEKVK